jgi:hypothetical protein
VSPANFATLEKNQRPEKRLEYRGFLKVSQIVHWQESYGVLVFLGFPAVSRAVEKKKDRPVRLSVPMRLNRVENDRYAPPLWPGSYLPPVLAPGWPPAPRNGRDR